MQIDYRVAADDAVQHRLFDAFLNRRNILFRNSAADDLVLDLDSFSALTRFYVHNNVTILSATTGLLDQLTFTDGVLCNRLAVSDLWLFRLSIHLKFPEHAISNNFKMQLSHPGDDRLSGILVGIDSESRVLFGQSL